MGRVPFSTPVFLKLSGTGNFRAAGPKDAIQYLEHLWPAGHSPHYRQAKVLCYAALDGATSAETARAALIDAGLRADIIADCGELDCLTVSPSLAQIARGEQDVDEFDVNDRDLARYFSAQDIVDDPSLSPTRKRALLAYWASDRNAVFEAPALRGVRGITVTIDSILDAMCSLDAELVDQPPVTGWSAHDARSW